MQSALGTSVLPQKRWTLHSRKSSRSQVRGKPSCSSMKRMSSSRSAISTISRAMPWLRCSSASSSGYFISITLSVCSSSAILIRYYPGILILTTNRVNIIDDAIKSRIHVSLHYSELGAAARKRLWKDFLSKAGMVAAVDHATLEDLGKRPFNGREIKNIVKVAVTFASYNNRPVEMGDVVRVINADEDGDA